MSLALRPGVRVALTLDGATCEVSADTLQAVLQDPATAPVDALRALFAGGFVTPQPVADALREQQRLPPATDTRWTLAPLLALTVTFGVDDVDAYAVDPAVAVFSSRDTLCAAQELHAELRQIVASASLDAAARGAPLPRARLQALLEARALLRPQALGVAAVGAAGAAWARLQVQCGDRSRVVRAPLTVLPAVHRLVAALAQGGATAPSSDDAAAALWNALRAVEGVREAPARSKAAQARDLERDVHAADALVVTHLGHAGVAVDAPHRRVLVDPVLYPDHPKNAWPAVDARALGEVSAIFFTHQHTDHVDAATLLQLSPSTPVYVPAGGAVPLARFLALFGFTHVHALAPGDVVDVGDGLCVHALPFFGEASERGGFAGLTFAATRGGHGVLLHADASPNHSGASILGTSALDALRADGTTIDVVFGTWWQQRQLARLVGPAALQGVPAAQWLDPTESCDCPPEFLAGLVQRSGARLFVTYAESGHELFLPPHARSAYIPTMALLWRTLDEVRAELRARTGVDLVEAQPYLRVRIQHNGDAPVVDTGDVKERRIP